MLSSLMPLLCRHEVYWSERHKSGRCRRCGTLQAQPLDVAEHKIGLGRETGGGAVVLELPKAAPKTARAKAASKAPTVQAPDRREALLASLQQLAQGRRPTCEEALDLVRAVVEDAHSADPVLFGAEAAGHFAQLDATRSQTARLASTC